MVQLKSLAVGITVAATLALVPTGKANAALITGVTASTNMGTYPIPEFNIQNTVNGVGLPGNIPSLTGIHNQGADTNNWSSAQNILTGNIDFNLNGLYNLAGFSFWNFNGDNSGGIKDVSILASTDGTNYTSISGAPTQFAIGEFLSPTPAQPYSFVPVLAKFVRFSVLSNYGASYFTGFSEVQFDGSPANSTPVPTPALLPGLIGLGIATFRKRKAVAVQVAEEV